MHELYEHAFDLDDDIMCMMNVMLCLICECDGSCCS